MASSSRPFESRTVSRLMAGYQNLQHGATTLFLKGRMALLGGVQVAVFPAYVVFQSIRTGYRRLQTRHLWQKVQERLTGKPLQQIPVTVDTPIRALLSVIQPQPALQNSGLGSVNYHGTFLRQSHAGGVLTNGDWHLVPVKQPIQGIASDLATRKLLLVTARNTIFEGLTENQQRRLEAAIILLLAEYAARQRHRQWEQLLQQPGLPLPLAEPNQWPLVRWFYSGMRWMQTSSLAALTNLFGEAEQREQLRLWPEKPTILKAVTLTEFASSAVPEVPDWLEPRTFVSADSGAAAMITTAAADGAPEAEDHGQKVWDGIALAASNCKSLEGCRDARMSVNSFLSVDPAAPEMSQFDWPTEVDTIEARVSKIDYIDHWFVQLLRWIDQGLYWLEQWAKRLWNQLRRNF